MSSNYSIKTMKSTTSKFSSHFFNAEVAGQIINYRILKMENSLFIYMGKKDEEVFDGLALGLMIPHQNQESTATSILESPESRDIAKKLSVRLSKPVFVSYNVNAVDRLMLPIIEKNLIQEIKERPECF